jgi:hypothetical protein
VLAAVEALAEGGHVEPGSLRDGGELVGRIHRLLPQPGMQIPELPLVRRAAGGFVRTERVGVKLVDRVMEEHVPDLSGIDVLGIDLRLRLLHVALAERAVIIGNLDERNRGGRDAVHRRPRDVHGRPFDGRSAELPAGHRFQKVAHLVEALLHLGL